MNATATTVATTPGYYVTTPDGRTIGPLTQAQIRERIQTGELTSDAPCAKPGDTTWMPLRDVLTASPAGHAPPKPGVARGVVLLILLLCIGAAYFYSEATTAEKQVMRVATQYLKGLSPRVQSVTPRSVEILGSTATLNVNVNGVNGFNAPSTDRKWLQLQKRAGAWKVVDAGDGDYTPIDLSR